MHYSNSHEWVLVKGPTATLGVSDYAQKELGEVVHIELPQVGATLLMGEEMAVLESTKAAADIYAPVSGVVEEVNSALKDQPQMINESAEDRGWIVKVRLVDPRQLDKLMDQDHYLRFLGK